MATTNPVTPAHVLANIQRSPLASVKFNYTAKAAGGQYGRFGTGANNNAASWQAMVACMAANKGSATGAQLMAAIAAAVPYAATNAAPFLNYCQPHKLGLQAPAKTVK